MTTTEFSSSSAQVHLEALVQNLKAQINDFTVFTVLGNRVGIVQDVRRGSNNQINVVVAARNRVPCMVIETHAIKTIDVEHRLIKIEPTLTSIQPSTVKSLYRSIAKTGEARGRSLGLSDRDPVKVEPSALGAKAEDAVSQIPPIATQSVTKPVRKAHPASQEESQPQLIAPPPKKAAPVENLATLCIADGELRSLPAAIFVLHAIADNSDHQCQWMKATLALNFSASHHTTHHGFSDPQVAHSILSVILEQYSQQFDHLHITLGLIDENTKKRYQSWLDHYCGLPDFQEKGDNALQHYPQSGVNPI